MEDFSIDHSIYSQPLPQNFRGNRVEFGFSIDPAYFEDRIDLDQISFNKFAGTQVAINRATHSITVGPRPIRTLLLVSEGERNLVNYEICASAIRERKYRDPQRGDLIVVGSEMDVESARINFNQMIQQGFAAVSFH